MTDAVLARLAALGFDLPESLGGFARGQTRDYNQPGLGWSVAYYDAGHDAATLYIYDLGVAGIPDGPDNDAVRQQFDQATGDVLRATGALDRDGVKLIERYGVGPGDKTLFYCSEFEITRPPDGPHGGGKERSYLYITGFRGQFVKVRITVRGNDPDNPAAPRFVTAVGRMLWPEAHAKPH